MAIGALLSFNYVSIKLVMSSKSRYMARNKSRRATKLTTLYVQSALKPPHVFHSLAQ